MKWFTLSFSIISTGGGLALFTVRDLSPLMRAAAQSLVILGLIIAVPAAIDAAEAINKRLNEWGVWQKIGEVRVSWEREQRARKQRISFSVRNDTGSALEIEFSAEGDDYWPGNNQVYILSPGAVEMFPLQCRFEAQKICFGAWVRGNTNAAWGLGYRRASGCDSCCAFCGGSLFTSLVYK
jgi:hypothetical protein